jgi:hypothetical protein
LELTRCSRRQLLDGRCHPRPSFSQRPLQGLLILMGDVILVRRVVYVRCSGRLNIDANGHASSIMFHNLDFMERSEGESPRKQPLVLTAYTYQALVSLDLSCSVAHSVDKETVLNVQFIHGCRVLSLHESEQLQVILYYNVTPPRRR